MSIINPPELWAWGKIYAFLLGVGLTYIFMNMKLSLLWYSGKVKK